MTLAELKGDVVILACAISAGIHGALVPGHFDEGTGAGLGFVAATIALAGVVGWLTARPASVLALGAAAAVFLALLASYALAVTSGLPLLHPEPEPVDGSRSRPRRSKSSASPPPRAFCGGHRPP